MAPETKAEREAKIRYRKEKRKQAAIEMSKEEFDAVNAYCAMHGLTRTTWIKQLIFNAIGYSTSDNSNGTSNIVTSNIDSNSNTPNIIDGIDMNDPNIPESIKLAKRIIAERKAAGTWNPNHDDYDADIFQ